MQSTDRSLRAEAFRAWADLYESVSDELDSIYSELIKVRCDMAKTLGFKDYIEMAYISRERYDYDRTDVERFRQQIVETIVPVCSELFRQQQERLGIDRLHYYDEAIIFPEGNAVPHGTSSEMVASALQMYRELSKETGEFLNLWYSTGFLTWRQSRRSARAVTVRFWQTLRRRLFFQTSMAQAPMWMC